MYVVRTQAGFRQALLHYQREPNPEDRLDSAGYPECYPAFVSFSVEYRGSIFIAVRSIHIKELRAKLDLADPTQ